MGYIKNKIINMDKKKLIVISSCTLLVIGIIIFTICSIFSKYKLKDASLYDIEATILYREYINYSADNTMHEEDSNRNNAIKYMTVYSINKILKEQKINLKEKYGNCFKDGVYELDGDLLENKIHEIFGDDIEVDYMKIFPNYNTKVNDINIKDTSQLQMLKNYPNLNAYSINGVYKSKRNEFLLYSCKNDIDGNISVNTTISKIQKNSDTIVIYDSYYLKISNENEVKYSDINSKEAVNKKKVGYYKHVFKKIDGKFRWSSTTKVKKDKVK